MKIKIKIDGRGQICGHSTRKSNKNNKLFMKIKYIYIVLRLNISLFMTITAECYSNPLWRKKIVAGVCRLEPKIVDNNQSRNQDVQFIRICLQSG